MPPMALVSLIFPLFLTPKLTLVPARTISSLSPCRTNSHQVPYVHRQGELSWTPTLDYYEDYEDSSDRSSPIYSPATEYLQSGVHTNNNTYPPAYPCLIQSSSRKAYQAHYSVQTEKIPKYLLPPLSYCTSPSLVLSKSHQTSQTSPSASLPPTGVRNCRHPPSQHPHTTPPQPPLPPPSLTRLDNTSKLLCVSVTTTINTLLFSLPELHELQSLVYIHLRG